MISVLVCRRALAFLSFFVGFFDGMAVPPVFELPPWAVSMLIRNGRSNVQGLPGSALSPFDSELRKGRSCLPGLVERRKNNRRLNISTGNEGRHLYGMNAFQYSLGNHAWPRTIGLSACDRSIVDWQDIEEGRLSATKILGTFWTGRDWHSAADGVLTIANPHAES